MENKAIINNICNLFKKNKDLFTKIIIYLHCICIFIFLYVLMFVENKQYLSMFLAIAICVLLTHLYFSYCILIDLELCFQDKYTTSDIYLKLLGIEINNHNRRYITTYIVSWWIILTYIKIKIY